MTPERKEEIATKHGLMDWHTLQKVTKELLAALEEAQQQVAEIKTINQSLVRTIQAVEEEREDKGSESDTFYEWWEEAKKDRDCAVSGLAEAQQTIARLTSETVNKQKLLEWLDVEIGLSSGNDPVLKADRWAFRQVKKEIESGRINAALGEGAKESC